ncbi:MAG: hypothetical protein KKE23_03460 [Nanoarchaeota archaeon]|nr:hypothetical protein [Nanoarchaeota archaeon]
MANNSYSKLYRAKLLSALGAIFCGTVGGYNIYTHYSKNQSINFSEFPNEKKLSISLEDYMHINGKNTRDYDMLEIYNCDQKFSKNTEIVVEYRAPCKGIVLIPKP